LPELTEGTREPFNVVLSVRCALDLEEKCAEIDRARQVYDGLMWRVSRDPSCGPALALRSTTNPNAEVRMIKTRLNSHFPTVAAIYLVEGRQVTVVSLKITKAGYDPVL
jgi:hypothetical protein